MPRRRTLNPHQLEAYQQIEAALRGAKFQTFLLQGVTGSGKTEVYLKSIDACIALGRSALLLVPEIALTPAVAGQFFHRFGDRVAILHSAFHDAERAEQWRRIRTGVATVVVGTRSGVFAPVQNLGLVVSTKSTIKATSSRRRRATTAATSPSCARRTRAPWWCSAPRRRAWKAATTRSAASTRCITLPERIEQRPMPDVEVIDMRQEFLETRKQATFLAAAGGDDRRAPGKRRADHAAAQSPRLFELRRVPRLRRALGVRQLRGHADLSPPRPPHAVPLLQLRAEGSDRSAPSATASICSSSAPARRRWKRSCIAIFPPRESRAWIATR